MTSNIDWSLHFARQDTEKEQQKRLKKEEKDRKRKARREDKQRKREAKKRMKGKAPQLDTSNALSEDKEQQIMANNETETDTNETKQSTVLKVAILGDRQVGIRTLMVRYIEGKYDKDYTDGLSINFMQKAINLRNLSVTILICSDKSRHYINIPLLCSDAKAIIFAFDLTQKNTLYSVKRYYKEARKENKDFRPFLVGTKYDLFAQKDMDYKLDITTQARKFASKLQSPLIYCSAAHDINIKKMFKLIVAKCFGFKHKMEMKEIYNINDAIFAIEWKSARDRRKIGIVFGYIRQVQREFEWHERMDIFEFANIILLFYANVVIGANNRDYKIQSRIHKKLQKKLRKLERKKLARMHIAQSQHDTDDSTKAQCSDSRSTPESSPDVPIYNNAPCLLIDYKF